MQISAMLWVRCQTLARWKESLWMRLMDWSCRSREFWRMLPH